MAFSYITDTGTVTPDTADTRNLVVSEFRTALGSDLITDDETPEGVLINAETSARQSVAANNALLANQVNPDLAGGVFLDAIAALTGGTRRAATSSTVIATVAGQANTEIPAGSRAATTAGDEFETVDVTTIPVSGSVETLFTAVNSGPVVAESGQLTRIVTQVLGWETVNNTLNAVPGQLQESDAELKTRRRRELALQARSVTEAIMARVSAVSGVKSLQIRENPEGAPATIDGLALPPHSVWVAVEGGASADIAQALLESKTAGAAWHGSEKLAVVDRFSQQSQDVSFSRFTEVPITIRLMVRTTTAGESATTAIRNTVLEWSLGQIEGFKGLPGGQDVLPFDISAVIVSRNTGQLVESVEVARVPESGNPVYQTKSLTIGITEIARVVAGRIVVVLT